MHGNIKGSDLSHSEMVKNSAMECQAYCNGYKGCQYWTFNSETNLCYPKTGDIDWKSDYNATKPSTTSGPKNCCFEKGAGLEKGSALTPNVHDNVKTVLECQRICQTTPDCKWFVLNSKHNCYLKYKFTERRNNRNATYGPRDCPNNLDENTPGIY